MEYFTSVLGYLFNKFNKNITGQVTDPSVEEIRLFLTACNLFFLTDMNDIGKDAVNVPKNDEIGTQPLESENIFKDFSYTPKYTPVDRKDEYTDCAQPAIGYFTLFEFSCRLNCRVSIG